MIILGKQYWYLSKHQIRKFDRFFAILSKWTMISGKVCRHISASGYQETMINWYSKPQKCITIKIISSGHPNARAFSHYFPSPNNERLGPARATEGLGLDLRCLAGQRIFFSQFLSFSSFCILASFGADVLG